MTRCLAVFFLMFLSFFFFLLVEYIYLFYAVIYEVEFDDNIGLTGS